MGTPNADNSEDATASKHLELQLQGDVTERGSDTNDINTEQQKGVAQQKRGRREITFRRIVKLYLAKGTKLDRDRWFELMLLFVVGFSAVAQLFVTISNNRGTSQQTDQIIAASKYSAYAADRNAQAAGSFADSAKGINQGVSNAVSKLQAQAAATEFARETAESNAKEALQSTAQNFRVEQRPWLYVQPSVAHEAVTWDDAIHWGIKFTFTVSITNVGKTPATDIRIGRILPDVTDTSVARKYPKLWVQPEPFLRDAACRNAIDASLAEGIIIFPRQTRTFTVPAWLPGSQIKAESANHSAFTAALGICVRYRPTYEIQSPYLYGNAYELVAPNPVGMLIVPVGKDFPANSIGIAQSPWANQTIK